MLFATKTPNCFSKNLNKTDQETVAKITSLNTWTEHIVYQIKSFAPRYVYNYDVITASLTRLCNFKLIEIRQKGVQI